MFQFIPVLPGPLNCYFYVVSGSYSCLSFYDVTACDIALKELSLLPAEKFREYLWIRLVSRQSCCHPDYPCNVSHELTEAISLFLRV